MRTFDSQTLAHSAKIACTALGLLLLAIPALAGHHEEDERKLKIVVDGTVETFDLDDLKIGETQEVVTDSGKVVEVTRTETGYDLVIDGREINVDIPQDLGDGEHRRIQIRKILHDCDDADGDCGHDDAHKKVIIKHLGDDDEGLVEEHVMKILAGEGISGKRVMMINGDGEVHDLDLDIEGDDITWIGEGVGAKVIHLGKSPAEHLIDSGVLDDLDEAKRNEILDALVDLETSHGKKVRKIVEEIEIEPDTE